MKKKKIIIFSLVIVLLLGTAAAVILSFDLNRFKPFIHRIVQDYTGRELTIKGDLRLAAIWPPTLSAEEIAFQNAPWGSQPDMVRVKRAACSLSLKPLLRRELHLFRIRLEEIELLLEFDRQGTSNFQFGRPDTGKQTAIPGMVFNDIIVQNSYVEYNDARYGLNAAIHVDDLKADIPGLDKPMQFFFKGEFRELPFSLNGSIGPLMAWIQPGYNLNVNLGARLGNAAAQLQGNIRDPLNFKDMALVFTANGPSTREIANLVHWDTVPDLGTFQARAELKDRQGRFAIENLSINVGSPDQVSFSAGGRIGDLAGLKGFDLNLAMQTRRIGNLLRLADMPTPPFEAPLAASGVFSDTAESRFRLDDFILEVGNQTIKGRIGLDRTRDPAVLDLQLASEHAVLGLFTLKTRMSGSSDRVRVDHLELQVGNDELFKAFVTGTVGSLTPLENLSFNFHVMGDDLANLNNITGRKPPPHIPYALSGTLFMANRQSLQVSDVKIILGKNSINGSLGLEMVNAHPQLQGGFTANRLNLQHLLGSAALDGVLGSHLSSVGPTRLAFQVAGPWRKPALNSIDLQTRIEDLAELSLKGSIKNLLALAETDLRFTVNGKDLANLGKILDRDLPLTGPYRLSGVMRNPDGRTYHVEELELTAPGNTLSGRSVVQISNGTVFTEIQLSTPNTSPEVLDTGQNAILDRLLKKKDLGPLKVKAAAVLSDKTSRLEALDLAFGKDEFVRLQVSGAVGDLLNLQDLQLDFQVSGRNIAALETITGKTIPVQGPYALSVGVTGRVPGNIKLRDLDLELGSNRFTGRADLNLTGQIPSIAAKIEAEELFLAPVTLEQVEPLKTFPDLGPLTLALTLAEKDGVPALTQLDLRAGRESTIAVLLRGNVGNLNSLGEVSLDVEVHSQDLSIFNEAFGTRFIEAKPFHAVGRLHDPRLDKITVTALEVAYGENDISGKAALDLSGDRPFLVAHLSSDKLDLRTLIKKIGQNPPPPRTPDPPATPKKRLFSREPFDLTPLQQVNAHMTFQGKEVLIQRFAFNDVDFRLTLNEGDLNIDLLEMNIGGGTAQGTFALMAGSSSPFTAASLTIDQFDIGPMLEQLGRDSTFQGILNTTIYLDGRGDSLAAMMAGLNGKVRLDIHDGQIASPQLSLLERYMGSNILDVINPFVKRPSHTTIHCLVNNTDIKEGRATYKMILDTEQSALVSAGTINLKTEKIDISIKPTPKKGFGDKEVGHISFSLKELSQPFGLGGTLLKPQLIIDPTRTVMTAAKFAGAAFFGPIGMTLFFTDISLGKKNICEEAARAMRKK